jgi:hypothetical protein
MVVSVQATALVASASNGRTISGQKQFSERTAKQVKIPVKLRPLDPRKPHKKAGFGWRRGSESNRRIQLLQSRALPLGYPAIRNRVPGDYGSTLLVQAEVFKDPDADPNLRSIKMPPTHKNASSQNGSPAAEEVDSDSKGCVRLRDCQCPAPTV